MSARVDLKEWGQNLAFDPMAFGSENERDVVRSVFAELEAARAVVFAARVVMMAALDQDTEPEALATVRYTLAKDLYDAVTAYDALGGPVAEVASTVPAPPPSESVLDKLTPRAFDSRASIEDCDEDETGSAKTERSGV